MTVVSIFKAGSSVLKGSNTEVTHFGSAELYSLIQHLFENMRYHNGVGLAAPQVGVAKMILVYGVDKNPRYPDAAFIPDSVLINPEIYFYSEEKQEYYEGCLSLPKLRGLVGRSTLIKYRAYTPDGKKIDKTATGFEARIIQHEVDHLKGLLYPSRMKDMGTFMYTET